jgi:hypothetical protein
MRNMWDRHTIGRPSQGPQPGSLRTAPLFHVAGAETTPVRFAHSESDEMLIVDERASLRPAECVERKLISLLGSVYLPVSHVRTMPLCKGRDHPWASSLPADCKVTEASLASTVNLSLRERTPLAEREVYGAVNRGP